MAPQLSNLFNLFHGGSMAKLMMVEVWSFSHILGPGNRKLWPTLEGCVLIKACPGDLH